MPNYNTLRVIFLNIKVNTKNTTANITRIKISFFIESKPKSNKNIFFNAKLETTIGLNTAKRINSEDIFSSGKIILEKNMNNVEIIIDENIIASSDLNKYPMNIPMKINTEKEASKTTRISSGIEKIFIFKIYLIPTKIRID